MSKKLLRSRRLLFLMTILIGIFAIPQYSLGYSLHPYEIDSSLYIDIDTGYTDISEAWVNAINNWEGVQNYVNFPSAPGTTNNLSDNYVASSSLYGEFDVTYDTDTGHVNSFNAYLNRGNSDIENNANVRESTATHELGHALGIDDVNSGTAIMNTNRDRTSITVPQTDDLNGIEAIYN